MILTSTDCIFYKLRQWEGIVISGAIGLNGRFDNVVVYDDDIQDRFDEVYVGSGPVPLIPPVGISPDHRFQVEDI